MDVIEILSEDEIITVDELELELETPYDDVQIIATSPIIQPISKRISKPSSSRHPAITSATSTLVASTGPSYHKSKPTIDAKTLILDNIMDLSSDNTDDIVISRIKPNKKVPAIFSSTPTVSKSKHSSSNNDSSFSPLPILSPSPPIQIHNPTQSSPKRLFINSSYDSIVDISLSQPLPLPLQSHIPPPSPEVIVKNHNILLSSPLSGDDDSSFNIKPSTYKSKPIISHESLNSSLNNNSNSFLDKLNNIESVNKKKYDTLREKLNNDQLPNSSPIKVINTTKKRSRSTDGCGPTAPIERTTSKSTPAIRTSTFTSGTTKQDRALAKEQKEREKREAKLYKELNKITRTKDELLSEMIITIPSKFETDFKIEDFNPIQVKFSPDQNDQFDDCIIWKRKVNSRYIKSSDSFEPCSISVLTERKLCIMYKVAKFVELIETDKKFLQNLKDIRKKYGDKFNNYFIVIVGLDTLLSKLKAKQERQYQANVRLQMGLQTNSKTKDKTDTNLTIDEIHSTISQLEINGFKIFPTKNIHETIQWLVSFTYTISSARYDKFERNQDLANIGTIRSGTTPLDTYEKILTQFKSMNSARAQNIISDYPTVRDLYDGMISGRGLGVGGNLAQGVKRLFSSLDETELLKDMS